jgi:hypothetical protein
VHAEQALGHEVPFLRFAKEIALSHQEKWDGSGYPEALVGEAIPLSARLMALADVYDAIISRRVYKEGMSHASAVHIITQGRGQHFDPDIVDAFLAILDEFQDIAARYADSDADLLVSGTAARYGRGNAATVQGTLTDTDGRALKGAVVEIWQCDALAQYRHPGVAAEPGRFDPGFQGFGAARSAADGSVAFRGLAAMLS